MGVFDADGHIRELEEDLFEYLPESYKNRGEAVLYLPLLPHHGWAPPGAWEFGAGMKAAVKELCQERIFRRSPSDGSPPRTRSVSTLRARNLFDT